MHEPSEYINAICSECNPRTYDMTLSKFSGEEEEVEVIDRSGNYSFNEYLYECCQCGFKQWECAQWVRDNAVEVKTIEQRQEYINEKGAQLDKIADAHEYMHRLSRIMLYHNLLTEIEVAEVKLILKGGSESDEKNNYRILC